jgi:mono/diheme cytochrome c family protein
LTPHFRVVAGLAVAIALLSACGAFALAAGGAGNPVVGPTKLEIGKRLYRTYCGQCHSLAAAFAAGFGSADNGFGQDGGPSFETLRVPFTLSFLAVTVPWAGHEVISHKMTFTQVKAVAAYIATVTKHHPALAQPIDG